MRKPAGPGQNSGTNEKGGFTSSVQKEKDENKKEQIKKEIFNKKPESHANPVIWRKKIEERKELLSQNPFVREQYENVCKKMVNKQIYARKQQKIELYARKNELENSTRIYWSRMQKPGQTMEECKMETARLKRQMAEESAHRYYTMMSNR